MSMRLTVNCAFFADLNDVQSLFDGCLCVEREAGINFSGNLSRDNLQDLLAELGEQAVERSIHLLVNVAAVALAIRDCVVNELGILGLLRCSQD
jgi:hypothetical protein